MFLLNDKNIKRSRARPNSHLSKKVTRNNENVSKDYDVHLFRISQLGNIKDAITIKSFYVKCKHRNFCFIAILLGIKFSELKRGIKFSSKTCT